MAKLNKIEVDRYFQNDLDITNRVLYIGSGAFDSDGGESGVDGQLAQRVIKSLHILDHQFEADDKPINIQLNCIGGEVIHGFAIYDAINHCKNYVSMVVYGHAMSMGSILLQAADERIMAPNSKMLLHYGEFSVSGETKTTMSWVEEERRTMKQMEDLYLVKIRQKHPKFTRRKIQEMLSTDTIIDAKAAVELGLADKVMGS